MKDYGTWWITVPPKPMNWRRAATDEEWAVERARHYVRLRNRAILRRAIGATLLIVGTIGWVLIKGGLWLLS